MRNKKIDRRDLIARFGLAGAFALAAMRFDRGLSAETPPGKFIGFHTSSGFWHSHVWPKSGPGLLNAESLENTCLLPLKDFYRSLLAIGGVSLGPEGTSWNKQGDGHNVGAIWLLTGNDVVGDGGADTGTSLNYASSASLDQIISSKRNRLGIHGRIAYPNFQVVRGSGVLSYGRDGKGIVGDPSPLSLFRSVFGRNGEKLYEKCLVTRNPQVSSGQTPAPPANVGEKMLVDANLSDFNDLLASQRLSAYEREIVQKMQAQFIDLEVKMAAQEESKAPQMVTPSDQDLGIDDGCERMKGAGLGTGGSDPSLTDIDSRSDLMFDIVTLAFALDLEDSAVLSWTPGGTGSVSYNPDHQHHGVSHQGTLGTLNEPDGTEKSRILKSFDVYHAARLAALCQKLVEVGTTGANLLDRTIILWSSEIAQGSAHNHFDVPMYLLGGTALGMPGGSYLRFEGRPSNARVLTALARRLGVQESEVSKEEYRKGGPLF